MIEALLKDAKATLDGGPRASHVPRGGFTDVGLHTGGKRRETAWPLTRAVFKVRSYLLCLRLLLFGLEYGAILSEQCWQQIPKPALSIEKGSNN